MRKTYRNFIEENSKAFTYTNMISIAIHDGIRDAGGRVKFDGVFSHVYSALSEFFVITKEVVKSVLNKLVKSGKVVVEGSRYIWDDKPPHKGLVSKIKDFMRG